MSMDLNMREAVSALTDGERPGESLAEVVDHLIFDQQLKKQWANDHLIGDAMRMALPANVAPNLAERVRAVVDSEPIQLPTRRRSARVMKPVVGFALAASVAVLAILGVRTIEQPQAPVTAVVADVQLPRTQLPTPILTSGNRWNVDRRSVEDRLNGYLVNHSEYAGYGVQGMLPYARIVGYDASQP